MGGGSLKGGGEKALTGSGIGEKGKAAEKAVVKARPKAKTPEEAVAHKLVDQAVGAKGERRAAALKELQDTKGVAFTEGLLLAIAEMDVEGRKAAREALAGRLTRMKAPTLKTYLKDQEVELRRAAALAIASREEKALIPDLIPLLEDPEGLVTAAAAATRDPTLSPEATGLKPGEPISAKVTTKEDIGSPKAAMTFDFSKQITTRFSHPTREAFDFEWLLEVGAITSTVFETVGKKDLAYYLPLCVADDA